MLLADGRGVDFVCIVSSLAKFHKCKKYKTNGLTVGFNS